ncbi:hypothetical protein CMI37_12650, partial [Candidatus Pacearchaeota archaeon]|nr:hypothetical protein [Candidatus Pacearchaeota archaeon]
LGVGLGNHTTPSAALHISSSGKQEQVLFRADGWAAPGSLFVSSSGKVGIGTLTPDYELDVAGNIGMNQYLYHNGDEDTYLLFEPNLVNLVAGGKSAIKLETSTGKIQLNNTNEDLDVQVMADSGAVILHTDATTRKVGIGTDTPTHQLAVIGQISASLGITGSSFHGDGSTLTGLGNVTGVDSAVDRSIMLASGTSGKAITGSNVTMDPAGNIAAPGQTFSVNQLNAGGGGVSGSGPFVGGSLAIGPNLQGRITSTGIISGSTVTASYFVGDGTNLTGITASPAGSDSQVQFRSGSVLGASSNFTFVYTGTNTLKVTGDISGSNDFAINRDVMCNRDITAVRDIKATNDLSASNDIHGARDLNINRDGSFIGKVTAGSSFVIGSADLNETDLEKLDGITDGTAAANKAVVLDGSKNIATIGTLGCGAITSTGASAFASLSGSTTVQGGDATFASLHVSGTIGEAIRIAKGASETREIVFENDGTDVGSIFFNAAETMVIKNESSNDDIQFQTKPGGSATTVMTIDGTTACVGLGTIDPLTKLDVRWDPTGSLDNDTGGGDVVLFGSGSVTAGKMYYLSGSTWTGTDASTSLNGADALLGLAITTSDGTATWPGLLIRGFFDVHTNLENFSAGRVCYMSIAASKINSIAPSGSSEIVRVVGHCTDQSNVIWFNPSGDWIELG